MNIWNSYMWTADKHEWNTGIARSWVWFPFKPEFFSGCFFNCLSWKLAARITISLVYSNVNKMAVASSYFRSVCAEDLKNFWRIFWTSVIPSHIKPGGPPGLSLEILKATWLKKDATMLEDTACIVCTCFLNFCVLIFLVIKFSMFCLCYFHL